eukprot:TRINITY_DN13189_c0_g1_i2.p1 TRINITY_DN13189_c0_g1~~TRINITY_DN13189_c0_g1_i2.p1  ORF type:complete len:524 (+),score=93.00 TRINITY_DN13189_c0_g1_i2:212-1573(+)
MGEGDASLELPGEPEELAALGEMALDMEELEDSMHGRWPHREERQAAFERLLVCDVCSPQALLAAVSDRGGGSGKCRLNQLLEEAGCRALKAEALASLAEQLEVRARQRIEVTLEGSRPILVTAPHNIYLRRDGHSPHVMEEYTTLIAQRLARQLGGACLSWSRAEQKRSELLWNLARIRKAPDPSSFLDRCNRDPNYLHTEEVTQNPWFRQMQRLAEKWRDSKDHSIRPTLHVDMHGCRDPPTTPSHLTVGLAAMRHEVEAGRSPLPMSRVECFGSALQAELTSVLSQLGLRPSAVLVRVLLPSLSGGRDTVERLSGAWALEERRVTQSQQAVAFAGFTHSCQLEMSKALRRSLSRDDGVTAQFGRAILKAWVSCCRGPRAAAATTKRLLSATRWHPVQSLGGQGAVASERCARGGAIAAPALRVPSWPEALRCQRLRSGCFNSVNTRLLLS